MHIHFLDPYRSIDSPIHALDARVKFLLTLAFIFTVSLAPAAAFPVYILLFSFILSVEILSGVGVAYVLKRSTLALPFVLAALPVIFTISGQVVLRIPLGNWTLTASLDGLERFLGVAFKSWLAIQAAIVMSASTSFPDLLHAMRAVGLPRLLVGMFGLTWRYLFVLLDEALRMMRARDARSGQRMGVPAKTGGTAFWRARVTGGMAGSLFLRALERSERIYVAMLSRGYDGEIRSLPMAALTPGALSILGSGLALLLVLSLLGFLFWG